MENTYFSMSEAAGNAYKFVWREKSYLLKIGFLPMLMQVALSLFIYFVRPEASDIESYLWGFPATVLFAWFSFIEVRLMLMGERLDRLPADPAYYADRRYAMQVSVLSNVLFYMGMTFASAVFFYLARSSQWGTDWKYTAVGAFIFGFMFWGFRFGVVPILSAVRYPVRPFLERVRGPMFSFRLLGMGLVCILPPAILLQVFASLVFSKAENVSGVLELTDMERVTIISFGAPLSLLVTALLNAAATDALRQMLGKRERS